MSKKKISKDALLIILLLVILAFQLYRLIDLDIPYNTLSSELYLAHGVQDTASMNFVTDIYLDYRFFDTIFEATLLFMSVSGVLYFYRAKEGE